MYERAARCAAERTTGADRMRRRWLAAALTCLRLAKPDHAFLARPAQNSLQVHVLYWKAFDDCAGVA